MFDKDEAKTEATGIGEKWPKGGYSPRNSLSESG
jgi:hypothetical protein